MLYKTIIDWLISRTTAVLFDPRPDFFHLACRFGQQIRPRVKPNCCCPGIQAYDSLLHKLRTIALSYSRALGVAIGSPVTQDPGFCFLVRNPPFLYDKQGVLRSLSNLGFYHCRKSSIDRIWFTSR